MFSLTSLFTYFTFALIMTTVSSADPQNLLNDGQYLSFTLNSATNPQSFSFHHPGNPAVSSKTINTFSVVFDQDIPSKSVMSLQITRDLYTLIDLPDISPHDNIFTFKFNEEGGDLTLSLTANKILVETGYTCRVVFNTEQVIVSQPTFSALGDFIYTKQFFRGTYSQLRLYKAYQIDITQPGYLLIKKYDCLGYAEMELTNQFTTNPKPAALSYQDLVQPPPGDSYKNHQTKERVYQVSIGTYYIVLYPGHGVSLSVEDAAKAYYTLETQFFLEKPSPIVIPSLVFTNLGSVKLEENYETNRQRIVFDSLQKGLPNILSFDISYTVVIGMDTNVCDYYSLCGVNAPSVSALRGKNSENKIYEWETKEEDFGDNGKLRFDVKGINLDETDLAAGVEAEIKLVDNKGLVSARIFYNSIFVNKREKEDSGMNILLILLGGLLVVLAIPVGIFVHKEMKKRKKRARESQYEISLPRNREKKQETTSMRTDKELSEFDF